MALEQPAEDAPEIAAFADETQFNVGRFRGVALVSAPAEDVAALRAEVERLLRGSGVRACKWEKVRSARMRFVAGKLLDFALDAALAGRLRVDALTWDTGDRERVGQGVPHIANLHRMYRELLAEALRHRWPEGGAWTLYPDRQTALRWETLRAGLPRLARIEPRRSTDEPLIQLADLFAGLAVFSRGGYDTYERWLCLPPHERRPAPGAPLSARAGRFSASDRERCLLLDDFFTRCKLRLPGISLRTQRGLRTYDPDKPITFRWYPPVL
jgi:hypothetical protein